MEITSLFQASSCLPSVMKSTRLNSSSFVSSSSTSISLLRFPRTRRSFTYTSNNKEHNDRVYSTSVISSCKRMENQDSGGGGMVDEGMIVLRLRIKELEMMERGEVVYVPSNWFEWEKKYFIQYQGLLLGIIGYLQFLLINSRPGLALGIMAFGILSVLFSSGLLTAHVIKNLDRIIAEISPF